MRKTHKYLSLLALGVVLMAGVSSCTKNTVDPNPSTPPQKSITEIVATDKNFSILRAAVTRANLTGALSAAGPLTLFAPNNDAFKASGLDSVTVAKMDPAALANVLRYHVVGSAVKSSDVKAGVNNAVTTLNGTAYASNFVYGTGSTPVSYGVSVNGSRVTLANIAATNGIVHVVDAVIVPPAQTVVGLVVADASFSSLRAAVVRAGLDGALAAAGPLTVFAPNNAAFQKFFNVTTNAEAEAKINALPIATLTKILTYHVVSGRVYSTNFTPKALNIAGGVPVPGPVKMLSNDNLTVSGDLKLNDGAKDVNIIKGNLSVTNGVVHVIDNVLVPTP